MTGKNTPMRADEVDKKALELFAAEFLLEEGRKLSATEALHEFINKYRSDLLEKATKQMAENKRRGQQE